MLRILKEGEVLEGKGQHYDGSKSGRKNSVYKKETF